MTDLNRLNGINVPALQTIVAGVEANPQQGQAGFAVHTQWLGGTRSRAAAQPLTLGDKTLTRQFSIEADEPPELLGNDTAANPQELLLAALNACMTVGFVANAAARGIKIDSLQIHSKGQLDLRGFLALDPEINPGYDTVQVDIHLRSSASPADIDALYAHVLQTSPNFNNFARPIRMQTKLHQQ
ncbi:OsmC family protein [Chitinimonas sp. PSY-7]|uniref:OsmC family protein n=1 Tax=Chitinimonas sp. PSY-7 TaxID=3459088 RepID=UPI00403FCA70